MKILMLGTRVDTMGGIASVVRNYYECGLMERLNIRYIATHRDGSKLDKIMFYLLQMPRIVINMPGFDFVHIHTSQGWSFRRLVVIFFIAKLFGKRTAWHVHGSQFDAYYSNACMFEKSVISYALAKASCVIVLSEAWKNAIHVMSPAANARVVHNAVNTPKYIVKRDKCHEPVSVLFLGRLGTRKGIYDLLQAIYMLKDQKIHFVLAGDGDVEEVRRLVKEKQLQEIVEVPGWVDSEDVVGLLHKADIYVLPSYDEGLPMGILEAMAAGLPVISTPVGGIPEAISEGVNGFLVEPGDNATLADRIKTLAENKTLWIEFSQITASRAINEFSMGKVEKDLADIYLK